MQQRGKILITKIKYSMPSKTNYLFKVFIPKMSNKLTNNINKSEEYY